MRVLAALAVVLAMAVAIAGWRNGALRPPETSSGPASTPHVAAGDEQPDRSVTMPSPDAPKPPAAPSAEADADDAQGPGHVQRGGGRCLAGTAADAKAGRVAVHRWVDANGILHFSDTPPAAGTSGHRVIDVEGVPPVVVRARGLDVNLPDQLVRRVIADAQAIERVMHSALGVEGPPGLVLDIVFIRSEEAYARSVPSPSMAGSAGAYSSRERTIHVRWQEDDAAAFRILRHELTHALVHEHVGLLPVVLNEGLAGFFERLAVSGLGAQVAVGGAADRPGAAVVDGDGVEALVDLLARDGDTFYGEGREARYRRAYALVATLMADAQGRAALAAVLAAQRADSCIGVDVARLLDSRYPGGLDRLAADWSHWLREAPAAVHAF
ncbi:MAG: DUF4124 domain-containing protein [Xanthomonadales bacterium]|nr:DUF4124 domain-containing protein [Xanthomonadales bacterium]